MTPLALRVALAIGALAIATPTSAQQVIDRGMAASPDIRLSIWIPSGTVRLIAWDRDSLRIEGTMGKDDRLYFGGGPAGAKFGIDEPVGAPPSSPAHITVHLPRGAQPIVRTVSASVQVDDVSGWFNTVSGAIRVGGTVREVQAETIDGSIQLTMTAAHVRARTGGGMLSVAGRVEDLIASTVSGSLTVTAKGLARGRVESMTGPIIMAAPLDRASSIDIDNHSGSVELQVASSAAVDFDLTSVAGTITNRFDTHAPAAGRQGRGQQLVFYTDVKGARIVVRTFKGPILLRQP